VVGADRVGGAPPAIVRFSPPVAMNYFLQWAKNTNHVTM